MELSFWVQGRPAAQGSKRHVGGGRMIEASRFVGPWRQQVTHASLSVSNAEQWQQVFGPVELELVFHIARPASVKESDRPLPIKPPDLDKLVRAVCDSLTDAQVWGDDGQVVKLIASKVYVPPGEDGCDVTVRPI